MVQSVVAHAESVWVSYGPIVERLTSSLEPEQNTEPAKSELDVCLAAVSEDGQFLIGISNTAKQVLVIDSQDLTKVAATHEFPKRPSAVSIRGAELVVSDKFGDVFHCPNFLESSVATKDTQPILGHVSMVLDVLLASPQAIITSDRDEHIRVSRFPQAYVIDRFLLAHDSFVSHLAARNELLVSGGGDKYVLLWNWQTGERLARLDVPANVTALTIDSKQDIVWIGVEGVPTLYGASLPDLQLKHEISGLGPVQSIASVNGHTYVAFPNELLEVSSGKKIPLGSETEPISEQHLLKRSENAH